MALGPTRYPKVQQRSGYERYRACWKGEDLSLEAAGPVFTSIRGTRLESRNLYRTFERVCGKARVPHTLHGLRHDFGSTLVAGGIPVATVAAILGHSSPAVTTRLYLHSHDPAAQAAVEVAADMFGRAPGVQATELAGS
jgi:integrase